MFRVVCCIVWKSICESLTLSVSTLNRSRCGREQRVKTRGKCVTALTPISAVLQVSDSCTPDSYLCETLQFIALIMNTNYYWCPYLLLSTRHCRDYTWQYCVSLTILLLLTLAACMQVVHYITMAGFPCNCSVWLMARVPYKQHHTSSEGPSKC